MAGTSLLALIDDIATLLDDVAVLTKVAAKKTAGVLGDDLALNAEQVTGVRAERELPVIWAVFKGALLNKVMLVPAALLISALAPWLIVPLLMAGGAFLCFEGFEKVAHKWLGHKESSDSERKARLLAIAEAKTDMKAFEINKIKGAIRTDFILSAEIIVITLGAVAGASLTSQVSVLCIIALGMCIGVYGLVAGIVKIDDIGLWLSQKDNASQQALGGFLLAAAPKLMKFLSVAGTIAMFLVGGGILVHGVGALHHLLESLLEQVAGNGLATALISAVFNGLIGLLLGAVLALVVHLFKRIKGRH